VATNLVNLFEVSKDYAARTILRDVTLGITAGERIGMVGQNGQGKSTLLRLIAGSEEPDTGTVTRTRTLRIGLLGQGDELDPEATLGGALLGERAPHEWAADRIFRGVLDGLLGGVEMRRFTRGLETRVGTLSGGERRRIALAHALLDHPDLLLLDEPTNHLDVEVIAWLAGHLAQRSGSLLVITHDRWFLDAVCTQTWEVADQQVHQYEGGYAAYVLARAERDRQQASREARRQQLLRKELAWLRRGPPARTSKPKFRIEAANALIEDEPPVRDSTELLRFAGSRLGGKVIEAENVSYSVGDRRIIDSVSWLLGPGERLALVGANGSGKTTLMRLLAGDLKPEAGTVVRGETVKLAYLSQNPAELPPDASVLEAVEQVRGRAQLSTGEQITAGRLAERFGFRGDRLRTRVRDLSGGERRRLTLMRLLMGEPNVLLLDEPTNDLDIDTLTALEDLLDGWPGTLVVVSHDRYFVERVCDNVYALTGPAHPGHVRHLPGGIEQYFEEIDELHAAPAIPDVLHPDVPEPPRARRNGTELRTARKEVQRLERELERLSRRERELQERMATAATDHALLQELTGELATIRDETAERESEWLVFAEVLES
jgi:ATP-binding cassette subfamily F protein uup